ncbi:hypothetical protein CDAR_9031 [Caerostris darwini]|uniref:Uncharacterized protein n=1 Tax=Caerostris darwini TaxID=1538125 RepID=A0AAV4SK57_9ARAC|nr:hypothetical protein CDAR_9031 [Caerostris darwini]
MSKASRIIQLLFEELLFNLSVSTPSLALSERGPIRIDRRSLTSVNGKMPCNYEVTRRGPSLSYSILNLFITVGEQLVCVVFVFFVCDYFIKYDSCFEVFGN